MDVQNGARQELGNYLATHIPIIQSQALDSLGKAQTKQKALYGKCRRKALTFKPGDCVWKKNIPDLVSFASTS
jgi:hypothetical protein